MIRHETTQTDCDGSGTYEGCEAAYPHAHCSGIPELVELPVERKTYSGKKILVTRRFYVGGCLSIIPDPSQTLCPICEAEKTGAQADYTDVILEGLAPAPARFAEAS